MIRREFCLAVIAALPVLACSPGEPRTAFAESASARKESGAEASGPTKSVQAAKLSFVLAPSGSTARYRVRERLVGQDLPSDAVGETKSITGAIAFDSSGKVIPQSSKFVLDAKTFVSDKDRRDGFVRRRLLEADRYPSILLAPTSVRGISLPVPTTGSHPIEITGDLTVAGVTRPTAWTGSVQFQDGRVTVSAGTAFTFDDIQMEQPRVPVLLSVADTIRLEIDFTLLRQQ